MFEIGKTEITDDFAPIPNGIYPAFVEKVEWKTSKAGAEYLNVMFKIFGENYGNRVVFTMFNVFHPKDEVKNIAYADLKKMFLASGLTEDQMNFTTKEDLAAAVKAVRCMIKLTTKTDDYGTKNVIKGYEELDNAHTSTNIETGFDSSQIPF